MSKPILRMILVSVDYGDLLEITLPYNRQHFDEVMVVTVPTDERSITTAQTNDAKVFTTQSFYDNGADFNKWKALEQGLDQFGRHGNICFMDADILWPKLIVDWEIERDCLYTPFCYLCSDLKRGIPTEDKWEQYRLRAHVLEFPGYTQIFNVEDKHLPKHPPWHQINWRHAGGADSFFQRRWQGEYRQRPPFKVIHLGHTGRNWCGRSTSYLDGTVPKDASDNYNKLRSYINQRRQTIRVDRKIHSYTYDHEKLFQSKNGKNK